MPFKVVIFQAIQSIVFQSSIPGLLKRFCSAAPFKKRFFYAAPLLDSLDVNDTCKRLIKNLKMHFCQWRNHTNAQNPRK